MMLPKQVQKYINKQKGTSKEKVRNIKYMFMRDLYQPLGDINKMKVPEVLAFLQRLEEDSKNDNKKDSKGKTRRMG